MPASMYVDISIVIVNVNVICYGNCYL